VKKLGLYLAHYFAGVAASSWQAGIRAVKIYGAHAAVAAAAPQLIDSPHLQELVVVFGAAAFWEMIDYFDDHPLPVLLPEPDPAPAAASQPASS
jgi:hypothetical protein